jgi:dihydrofolate reductase
MPRRDQGARRGVTRLHLIFARAANGVIGKDGGLPWHLPEDLAHFKRTTSGHPVIMGRKTWQSLPVRFRPLPGRQNIVVTRQPDWQAEGAQRAGDLQQALALCPADADVWVIGGAEVFHEALALAHTAVVTELHAAFDGDVHAPTFGPAWRELRREAHTAANGLAFSFVTYQNTARGD